MAPRSHKVRGANRRLAGFKAVTLFLALAWLNVWSGVVISAPSFQDAGALGSGNGTANRAWPARQINDIALLFMESAGGEAATLCTRAGFVAITTSMATPRADPGNHVVAQILTDRGAVITGNPRDIAGGGVKAPATGMNVIDADGVSHASNPVSFCAATAGNGIACQRAPVRVSAMCRCMVRSAVQPRPDCARDFRRKYEDESNDLSARKFSTKISAWPALRIDNDSALT
jgi:hypothetical protein